MRKCISTLVPAEGVPDGEDLEVVCNLLATSGELLDRDRSAESQAFMKEYFGRLSKLSKVESIESRIRYRLVDMVELRLNGWKSKPAAANTNAWADKRKMSKSGVGVVPQQSPAKGAAPTATPASPATPAPAAASASSTAAAATKGSPTSPASTTPTTVLTRTARASSISGTSSPVAAAGAAAGASSSAGVTAGGAGGAGGPAALGNSTTLMTSPTQRTHRRHEDTQHLERAAGDLLDEYFVSFDADEACECIRELDSPGWMHRLVVIAVGRASQKASPSDRKLVAELVKHLCKASLLDAAQALRALEELIDDLVSMSMDFPLAASVVGYVACAMLVSRCLTPAEVGGCVSERLVKLNEDDNAAATLLIGALFDALVEATNEASAAEIWEKLHISVEELGLKEGNKVLERRTTYAKTFFQNKK